MAFRFNKVDLVIRLLGTLVGVAGLVAIAGAISTAYSLIFKEWVSWIDGIFVAIFMLPLLALGIYGIVVGFRLYRPLTTSAIRHLCAVIAILAWLQIGIWSEALIERVFPPPDANERPISPTFFIGAAIAAILYVKLTRWMIARSSVTDKTVHPVSTQLIAVVCFTLWLDVSSLWREVTRRNTELTDSGFAAFGGFFGPILLAFLVYKIAVHYAQGLPGLPFIGPFVFHAKQTRIAELHKQRIRQFQCPECEYNVRQTLSDQRDTCPECGFKLSGVKFPWLSTDRVPDTTDQA